MVMPIIIERSLKKSKPAKLITSNFWFTVILIVIVLLISLGITAIVTKIEADDDRVCQVVYGKKYDHKNVTIDDKGNTKMVCKHVDTGEEKEVPQVKK